MTPQERYTAAAHAVQTGVKYDLETDPVHQRYDAVTREKHLRTGIDLRASDAAGLVTLLIAKGIITKDEYEEAVAGAAEAEQARYEQILSDRLGSKITLA